MERIEKLLKDIKSSANCLVAFVIIGGLLLSVQDGCNSSYNKLRNKVSILADTDKNNITTIDEWKKVYQELGVNYNELRPQELSKSKLKEYISKHQF